MSVVFMASIASSYPLHLTKPSPIIHSPASSSSFSVTHQFLPAPRQERTPTSCSFAKFGVSLRIRHGNKGRSMNSRYRVVYASLFGVGAPEALVIGVVALLVFGPKGLAEVARNLGKTLRAFRPTIQELQEVSRDFRSTLEREIGLDDVSVSQNSSFSPTSPYASPNPSATTDKNGPVTTGKPYSAEEYLKVTEDQLRAVASDQQGGTTPITSTDTDSTITEVPSNVSPPANSPDQNGNR